jgi:hypothetical protein
MENKMKKLITALVLSTTIPSAYALNVGNYVGVTPHTSDYDLGYHDGKHHAYNNAAKVLFFTGFTIIAGIIVYELGKESCWTTNEKGIVYKF